MRLYLASAERLRREFPTLAEQVQPFEERLSDELVADLAARASSSFEWISRERGDERGLDGHPETYLGHEEVRLSVAIALFNSGRESEALEGLNLETLHAWAVEARGLRENHVIGAGLFDKPVAGPEGIAVERQEAYESTATEPTIADFFASASGQTLLRALYDMWRRAGGDEGPSPGV